MQCISAIFTDNSNTKMAVTICFRSLSQKIISFVRKNLARRLTQSNLGGVCNNMNEEFRWIHCPICGNKTRTKIYQNTVMFNFPLFCPKCKKETSIDVMQLKMAISKTSKT